MVRDKEGSGNGTPYAPGRGPTTNIFQGGRGNVSQNSSIPPALTVRPPVAPPRRTVAPPRPPSAPIAPNYSGRAPVPNRVGNSPTGTIAPVAAPPPPAPPDINSFLAGDTTYQEQLNQLRKSLGDYQANQKLQQSQYNTQYGTNTADLTKQKGVDLQSLQDDYGSRGLLQSGLFTKAYGDLSNDYANRQKALDTGKSDFMAQLAQAFQTYQNGQSTTSAKAKQDAINRRAAQYGL